MYHIVTFYHCIILSLSHIIVWMYRCIIVSLYHCITILRRDSSLWIFQNVALRKLLGYKREWRKPCNEELRGLSCSPNVIQMRWGWGCRGEKCIVGDGGETWVIEITWKTQVWMGGECRRVLTCKNRASPIEDGRTATLQMLRYIYI
jgi:hypothetical protein